MEEEEDFLKVLRALRDAARSVEAGDNPRGAALHALLALEAGAADLLGDDPSLSCLRRLLQALWCSADLRESVEGGVGVRSLRAQCRQCRERPAQSPPRSRRGSTARPSRA
jgi:hypothetical protein